MGVTTPTYLTVLELVSCPDPVTPGTRPIWNETVLQFATATPTSFHMIYAGQNFECPLHIPVYTENRTISERETIQ